MSSTFRKALGVVLVLCTFLVVVFWAWLESEDRKREAELEAAKGRIPISDVEFDNMRLGIGGGTLTGRVRNRSSRFLLTGARLQLTVRDCPTDTNKCEIIWQGSEDLSLTVPPQPARDFDDYVIMSRFGASLKTMLEVLQEYQEKAPLAPAAIQELDGMRAEARRCGV